MLNNKENNITKPWEEFLVRWNIRFRYDRLWRKRHNITFNSPQHREINQIDIFLDLLEEHTIDSIQSKIRKNEEYKKIAGRGQFLKERESMFESEEEIVDYLKRIKFGK